MKEIRVLSVKCSDGDVRVFRYAAGQEKEMVAVLADMAKDPQCSNFGWLEAALLSYRMGRRMQQDLEV